MKLNLITVYKYIAFAFIFVLVFSKEVQAQTKGYFDYNNRCKQAYESIMSLRINEGTQLLNQELKEHPQNLIPVMLADYADLLVLVLNGDKTQYNRLKNNLDIRLLKIEKGDKNSPWYRFAKANLYLHWAAIHIRFEENFSAGTEFRKSFLLLKDNKRLFPNFKYNQVLLGLEEAVVGTVPQKYQWLANMLGMKGSVKNGTAQVVSFLNTRDASTEQMRQEAVFYYCFLKFHLLGERAAVWKYIKESDFDTRNNLMYAYMKSNLALNDNKAATAEQILRNIPQSGAYLEVPMFNYLLGNALLLKMDDDCIAAYQKFISRTRGKIMIKDAYQKMSLYYYAVGNTSQGSHYKSKILDGGSTLIDADKQAQRFALGSAQPNATLVKARLLCDGGYFDKALTALNNDDNAIQTDAEHLEYSYRIGRIYQLMGQASKAIPEYEKAIKLGANRQEQFGARASFELGQIYEAQGQIAKAIAYYKKCVDMKDHDFEASLETKAKAGLNRLGAS